MKLLSIDPGKLLVGWALFDNNDSLVRCGLVRSDCIEDMAWELEVFNSSLRHADQVADELIIEVPQIYPQRAQKGDPNDCIDVALVAGMSAMLYYNDETVFVRPKEWKGQRPKDIDNAYTLKCLEPAELKVYEEVACIASLRHNILDAIGIGLWKLNRR